MATVTMESFGEWMAEYGRASRENDPAASAAMYTEDAAYYETPFAEPVVGREAIFRYWENGARNLRDKECRYEILALNGDVGIARWQATFVNVKSGSHVALDCVFAVEFDEQHKCRVFREWWHSRVTENGRNALPQA